MTRKPARKPKLTDAERHARFLETARKVEASEEGILNTLRGKRDYAGDRS